MMLFDSEYAIYAEYLKSAIKLFKAGKKDGAFEMYMRNYLAPEVLPDELPQEKVEEACKNIFDKEVSEVEITLDMLQRGLDGWYAEAKRLLECEFTMAFSEKYFTQEFMQDLFDEEFPHADSDGTIASLIARREKYYLGQ